MSPRISLIAAADTHGDLYLSLHQSNTNQDSFCNYIFGLVVQLDKDRPNWREDTIWQLDGAKYHLTGQVMEVLKKHKVPALVSAPYSFDVAPCELFFAAFKSGEINLQQLAVGKSKCTVILMSFQSILTML